MIPRPTIHVLVTRPFDQNTLLVALPGSNRCVVVDPGFGPQRIIAEIDRLQWTPVQILLTHGHIDHIAGNEAIKKRWPEAPIWIGRFDAPMLTDATLNLSKPFGMPFVSPPADRLLEHGETIEAAGMSFEVRHIPGHSPGHVVFIHRATEGIDVLGGDVLFQGSIGRTDFPGGSQTLLVSGIREKLFDLDPAAVVYPGHGPTTTIGEEIANNPFCGLG